MSRPVRLPDYLHGEVERLAKAEKRSTANMVKLLLEQALQLPEYQPRTWEATDEPRHGVEAPADGSELVIEADAQPRDVQARTLEVDPHFRPDFKTGKKK